MPDQKTYVSPSPAWSAYPRWMAVFAALALVCGFLFWMPGSFLPEENGVTHWRSCSCRRARPMSNTNAVFEQMRGTIEKQDGYEGMMQVAGFSFVSRGENVGMAFINSSRGRTARPTASEFISRRTWRCFGIRDASDLRGQPAHGERAGPASSAGFDMYLQDRGGAGATRCRWRWSTLLGKAAGQVADGRAPELSLAPSPQLELDVDRVRPVDGPVGGRHLQRDPADAGAGVRQRLRAGRAGESG